jgi:hypothetical protein
LPGYWRYEHLLHCNSTHLDIPIIAARSFCCTALQESVDAAERCCSVIDHPYTPRASRAAFTLEAVL